MSLLESLCPRVRARGPARTKSARTSGVALLAASSAAAQALAAVASPVITRVFSPEDLGAASVFLALLSLMTITATLRFELAVPLVADDAEALQVLALSGLLILASMGIVSGLVLAIGPWAAGALGAPLLESLMWLLPVGLGVAASYQGLTSYAIRNKAYGRVARTRLGQSIAGLAVSLGVGLATLGPAGLLVGAVVGQSLGVASLCRGLGAAREGWATWATARRLPGLARRYSKFPKYSLGSGLLNSAGFTIVPILVSTLYGGDVAGNYSLAARVIALPMAVVGQAVAQVFLGEASALARSAKAGLWPLMRGGTVKLLPLVVIVLGAGALSPRVFGVIFGTTWAEAGEYAALLALAAAAQLAVAPVSAVVFLVERQELQLLLDGLRAGAVMASFYSASALGGGPKAAVATFAASMVVIYVSSFFVYRSIAQAFDSAAT